MKVLVSDKGNGFLDTIGRKRTSAHLVYSKSFIRPTILRLRPKNAENFSTKALAMKVVLFAIQ